MIKLTRNNNNDFFISNICLTIQTIMKTYLLLFITVALCFSCKNSEKPALPLLDAANFSTTIDGKPVSLYTLDSGNGVYAQITNYGARVVSLFTPDKHGKYEDLTLGFESIDRYLDNKGERFLGPVVGRYANRIANGKFILDGTEYTLAQNNNGQSLHGGVKGLDRVVWTVDRVTAHEIALSYLSPDGEEGYPGAVILKVVYALTSENELKITYDAVTDKPTVVNLSCHAFFNLKGAGNGTIEDHILTINAGHITPVDSNLIPTGELMEVAGTPFDFRTPTAIGARIGEENGQLKCGKGYDHNWAIDKTTDGVECLASLYEPTTGRYMEVWSDQPGLQFYSGNFFNGKVADKYNRPMNFRESIALETQKFPDSPNHPDFPSTRLNPGEVYTHTCIYKFLTKDE